MEHIILLLHLLVIMVVIAQVVCTSGGQRVFDGVYYLLFFMVTALQPHMWGFYMCIALIYELIYVIVLWLRLRIIVVEPLLFGATGVAAGVVFRKFVDFLMGAA